MLRKILEDAIASAMSRAMLEARLEWLFERVRDLDILSDEEIDRLRAEIEGRLREVEREGRALRSSIRKQLEELAERLFRR